MRYRPGGPRNPFTHRVVALRSVMLDTVGEDDLKAIVARPVEQAKAGDVVAAREVLTRIIGTPPESSDRDRTWNTRFCAGRIARKLLESHGVTTPAQNPEKRTSDMVSDMSSGD